MAKRAGKSVQAEATDVLADPRSSTAARKKAVFAKNAARWNHTGPRKSKGPRKKK